MGVFLGLGTGAGVVLAKHPAPLSTGFEGAFLMELVRLFPY